MDRKAWCAVVHGVTKSRTQPSGWTVTIAAAAKSLQSCPTLRDPIDGSPTGSPVPGILQARTLEWVAISFSNAGKWKVKMKSLSRVRLFVTPRTAAYQAPPSMGLSRPESWSGLPLPSPELLLLLLPFFKLFSQLGCYRILRRDLCAIQQVLVGYPY